jgi:uncharacterized damage-inducible protein DinB
MPRPNENDYATQFSTYIDLVPEEDICSVLETQSGEMQRLLSGLDESRAAYRYAAEKWSVKQVIGHVTDCERIFTYRLLAIARGETQSLPGFDENTYVENAGFDSWRLGDLAESYALTRRSLIVLLQNLPAAAWERRGIANENPITVRALAFAIVGHERHHVRVLREKYLV